MINTVFDPFDGGKSNKSLDTLIHCIENNDYKVHPFEDSLSFSAKARSIKIIHLNWFESLRGSSRILIFYRFFKKCIFLAFFILSGKKIIWTMHNRTPHEVKSIFLTKVLINILVKCSSRIMIYSNYSRTILNDKYKNIDSEIMRVPHPNFVGDYGEMKPTIPSKKLRLLFLGEIRPYKNIELLIDVLSEFNKSEVELKIVGRVHSADYKVKINSKLKDLSNITTEFGFVKDEDIPSYLADCDLLIMPFNIKSSLNSGSAILAFSYAKTVICPYIATIMDLENKDKVLHYDYNNNEEHLSVLKKTICKAINLKRENPEIFTLWGQELYKEMLVNYSKGKTQQALKELYDGLV